MSFLNSVLKVFVGDKSKQDVKAITPIVEKIKALEPTISGLSHDELRAKTTEFKATIAEAIKSINDEIAQLKDEAENTEDIDKREDIYEAIDKLNDDAYNKTEEVLNTILPEAFAVIKETAKRFTCKHLRQRIIW